MKIIAAVAIAALASVTTAARAQVPHTTFEHFESTGNIVIAHMKSVAPLSYVDDTGKPAGFLVDVCQAVAQSLSKKRGKRKALNIVFSEETFATRIPSLLLGKTDLDCTGMAPTRREVEFSVPLFVSETRFLVKKDLLAGGDDVATALQRQAVVILTGTTIEKSIRSSPSLASMSVNSYLYRVQNYADAVAELAAGRAAAFAALDFTLARYGAELPNPGDYVIAGEPIETQSSGIAVRKSDPEILDAVNQILQAMVKSGEIARLYAKAFAGYPVNTRPMIPLPASKSTLAAWRQSLDQGGDVQPAANEKAAEVKPDMEGDSFPPVRP